MQLNPDCIRDILFTVERMSEVMRVLRFPKDWSEEQIERFGVNVIDYHIRYCIDAGLITPAGDPGRDFGGNWMICDLTPAGHEFIANIRKDTNWAKVKATAAKAGSSSLSVLKDIAAQVLADVIKSQFT